MWSKCKIYAFATDQQNFDPDFSYGSYIPPGPIRTTQSIQSFGSDINQISSISAPNSSSHITRHQPNPLTCYSPLDCSSSVSPAVSNSSSTEDETKKPIQFDKWSQLEQKYLISLSRDRFDHLENKDARKFRREIVLEINKRFETKRTAKKCIC